MSEALLVHEAEFVVTSELGLHARPAGQFVALADRLSKYGQKNILVASEFLAKKAAGPAGPA